MWIVNYFYPAQPKSKEESLIDIKIGCKQIERQSIKAMKESEKDLTKAKQALRKNYEEGAKLYIQSAASKRAQSLALQRTMSKMQFIMTNMKTLQNNEILINSFQTMASLAKNSNPNFQKLSQNISQLDQCLDRILISHNMVQQMMSNNQSSSSTTTIDTMLEALKEQLTMETFNKVQQAGIEYQKKVNVNEKQSRT